MGECPSCLLLASRQVGDLSLEQVAAVDAHVQSCAHCQERRAEIAASMETYERQGEARRAALFARIASDEQQRRRLPLTPRLFAAAAAALALLAVVVGVPWSSLLTPDEETTAKGALAASVIARRGDTQFFVTDGAVLHPGDALRFVLTASTAGYATVFSRDARGALSPFYPDTDPERDPAPYRIPEAGRRELEGSIILDDAAGPESLVVVFAPAPFARGLVHAAVARLLALGEPLQPTALGVAGGSVVVIRIHKEPAAP